MNKNKLKRQIKELQSSNMYFANAIIRRSKELSDLYAKNNKLLDKFKMAEKAYIKLINNRDHANDCYFANNKLMDKFDKAFE